MKYLVTVAGRDHEVTLDGNQVTVDGVPVAATVSTVPGTPLRHLVLDGRSVTLAAEPAPSPSRRERNEAIALAPTAHRL